MGEKKETTQAIELAHRALTSVFGTCGGTNKRLLTTARKDVSWSSILEARRDLCTVNETFNKMSLGALLAHPDMPTIAFQVGIFYFYVSSIRTSQDRLPRWMQHLIIYGDVDRFFAVKALAARHSAFFITVDVLS